MSDDITNQPTGAQVWEALNQLPRFQEWPAAAREVARPFVEAMPAVIAGWLEQPVTFENFGKSYLVYRAYMLENGYFEQVTAALNPEVAGEELATLTSIVEREEVMKNAVLEQMLAEGVTAFGVSEQEYLLSPGVEFNEAARTGYLAGGYTIGGLIKDDPNQIFDLQPEPSVDDVLALLMGGILAFFQ